MCRLHKYTIVHFDRGESSLPAYLVAPKDCFSPIECKFTFSIRRAYFSDNYPSMRNMCDDFNARLKAENHRLGGFLKVVEFGVMDVKGE